MKRRSSAQVFRGTPHNLALLAGRLRRGEIVAAPTETVYGLAADAFNAGACRRIFKAKGRPMTDPLIVHIASWRDLGRVARANPAALRLARRFWPGPLTLVLPRNPAVPGVVSAGLDSVAVRMPSHRLFLRLIRAAGTPLAAPSANPFGYVSPTTAEHVRQGLGSRIRSILDGGPSQIGLESTIVDMRDPGRPRLLRPGAVTRREIEKVLGVGLASGGGRTGRRNVAQVAPGLMKRHYSPRTPVVLHERIAPAAARKGPADVAWLFVSGPGPSAGRNFFCLDQRGDLRVAARRLFSTLRHLDEAGFRLINAELARGEGLAEAINDRLRRAARPSPAGAARSARGSRS